MVKNNIKMNKYIIDRTFVFCVFIWLVFWVPHICGRIGALTIIIETVVIISYGYLYGRNILLLFDLLLKKSERIVYFSKMSNFDNYELFWKKNYCEWQFYSAEGILELLVPVALTEEEIHNMKKPKADQKVKICFYKHTKILYSWEAL